MNCICIRSCCETSLGNWASWPIKNSDIECIFEQDTEYSHITLDNWGLKIRVTNNLCVDTLTNNTYIEKFFLHEDFEYYFDTEYIVI